ncbi:coiled-coil domain-containing protein 181-like [Anneissia japonica]|uniref:coiled-coil domain-containing protein 181-like n=1 Tax=Anneissia japonica TaxID=1529436 RepID=UPI0014258A2D|nr:coiled-coil domain-containing protein 181-like [Anneissia japonica]XP_033100406.1 coiled-coil domain-containing protein 181-like [Anneissia japonica]
MEVESPSSLDYGNNQFVKQDFDCPSEENEHLINSNISSGDNYIVDEMTNQSLDAVEEADNSNQNQLSDEELQILAEQKAVERELQQLKEEGFLPMEEPPEYDVRQRIAQLNAELAAEGTIPDKKNQSVQFRDDPVTDIFPVTYYENEDYDYEEDDQVVNDDDSIDQEVAKLTLNDSDENNEGKSPIHREQMKKQTISFSDAKDNNSSDEQVNRQSEEDTVVVERDGKFEVVNAADLTTEERTLMGLDPVKKTESALPNINNSETHSNSFQPERPSTAGTYSAHKPHKNLSKRRVQSARAVNQKTFSSDKPIIVTKSDPFRDGTFSEVGNEKSRYGLTQEQKEHQRQQARLKKEKLREKMQEKEEEERKNKSERDEAFQAWVQQKQENKQQKRKEERNKRKSESDPNKPNPDDVFKSWLEGKKRQSNLERRYHKQLEQESKQCLQQRSRAECEKSYKAWVRSKNQQLREQQSLSRAQALSTKQQAQRSRKSRTLAKALQVAQTYRYTDYYGYRF